MSKWSDYVKKYAAKHKISYKEAMTKASPSYRKMNEEEKKKRVKKDKKKNKEIDELDKKPYCGIKNVPKTMRRGTAEECYNANQVKYYGIKEVDISKMAKKGKKQLTFEEVALQRLNLLSEAKGLVNKVKNLKLIMEVGKPAEQEFARKKLEKIVKRRDILVKEIKDITTLLRSMEEDKN